MCISVVQTRELDFELKLFREGGEMGNHGDTGSILDRKDSDC